MKKWNMIIDVAECEDCNNCFLACKDEHVDNDFAGYSLSQFRHGHRWMNIMRKERGQGSIIDVAYLPVPCMHCDHAPCVSKGNGGAVYKRDDGIVIIDPIKAKDLEDLVDACPYGCIWWNDELKLPQKCGFCAHLLDNGWQEPRCVQACPTGALRFLLIEEAEMEKMVASNNLEVLYPEYETRPRVYYKNLYRFNRCFIAGSVGVRENGLEDCAKGAEVALFSPSMKKLGEQRTDNFGDFKFDNLEENSGKYILQISHEGYNKTTMEVDLKKSLNIGVIFL